MTRQGRPRPPACPTPRLPLPGAPRVCEQQSARLLETGSEAGEQAEGSHPAFNREPARRSYGRRDSSWATAQEESHRPAVRTGSAKRASSGRGIRPWKRASGRWCETWLSPKRGPAGTVVLVAAPRQTPTLHASGPLPTQRCLDWSGRALSGDRRSPPLPGLRFAYLRCARRAAASLGGKASVSGVSGRQVLGVSVPGEVTESELPSRRQAGRSSGRL
jgi:hypothetical protein